jgi:hypothetical protein
LEVIFMDDNIVKAFITELEEGAKYSPLPSEYKIEDVVGRAKELCPHTPAHIFHGLLN